MGRGISLARCNEAQIGRRSRAGPNLINGPDW